MAVAIGASIMMFGGGSQPSSQGYIKPIFGADLSIRKDFLKNNAASLTLQFSDIFRTRLYATHSEGPSFIQDNERRRDPQFVRLNFNWRFGKIDVSLFKRKNLKGEMENMQNAQQEWAETNGTTNLIIKPLSGGFFITAGEALRLIAC